MNQTMLTLQTIENTSSLTGIFYVIETFPNPHFVTDEGGEITSFDNYESAFTEAGQCQEGFVVSFS
jgi:hypothetical protein